MVYHVLSHNSRCLLATDYIDFRLTHSFLHCMKKGRQWMNCYTYFMCARSNSVFWQNITCWSDCVQLSQAWISLSVAWWPADCRKLHIYSNNNHIYIFMPMKYIYSAHQVLQPHFTVVLSMDHYFAALLVEIDIDRKTFFQFWCKTKFQKCCIQHVPWCNHVWSFKSSHCPNLWLSTAIHFQSRCFFWSWCFQP